MHLGNVVYSSHRRTDVVTDCPNKLTLLNQVRHMTMNVKYIGPRYNAICAHVGEFGYIIEVVVNEIM